MENTTIYNDELNNDMTSIENTLVTASVQSDADVDFDDFDRLLDDFIRKSLDEDTEDEGSENKPADDNCGGNDGSDGENEFVEFKYGSINFELGGNTYEIPKQPYSCKASKLVLSNGSYEEQTLLGEPVVFVSKQKECLRPFFVAHAITGFKEEYAPAVYIYRASESYPVGRVPLNYDNDENSMNTSCMDVVDALPCGNYFFFICGLEVSGLSAVYKNCNGGCCIPFVKVNGEMELPLVALDVASVEIRGSHYSLDVALRFNKMLDKRYAYSLFLYNRNYNLISRGAAFPWDTFSNRKRKNLLAHLVTEYIPFGEYWLFILQNGIPQWRVELSVDGGSAAVKGIFSVRQFGLEYLILCELEKDYSWHRFREGAATFEMKNYFLSVYQRSYLNKKRSSMGLSALTGARHFVYYGGCGTMELGALGSMSRMFEGISYFDSVDCITLTDTSNAANINNSIAEQFSGCNNKCIALYNISALVGNGSFAVRAIIDAMNRYSSFSVCLVGSRAEVAQLFESFPQLKRYFPADNCISSGNLFAEAFVNRVVKELVKCDLRLSLEAQLFLLDTVRCAEDEGCLNGMKIADVCDFVKTGIVENFISRTISSIDNDRIMDKEFLSRVEACDIDKEKILWKKKNEFEDSIRELNMMVGLNDLKKNITTTFNRLRISAERRRLGLRVKGGECHHMLFTGNPGTGKTTVAKMMGRIYHSLGLLSKGDVVFVDRSKIVGRYIGETESNMQRILNEAKGNILFIDEAYTLCDSKDDRKDFGCRAIECLLTVMAQDNCDMIVIFAGYAKEIDMMMRCNQGLSGRFPYKFDFADYSADELMQIAELKLSQEDYELTPEARTLLYRSIEETVKNKEWDFSNARWIGQYIDNGIIPAQCERLMQCSAPINRDDYRLIRIEDVSAAYALYKQTKKERRIYREIGFTA